MQAQHFKLDLEDCRDLFHIRFPVSAQQAWLGWIRHDLYARQQFIQQWASDFRSDIAQRLDTHLRKASETAIQNIVINIHTAIHDGEQSSRGPFVAITR